MLQNAKKSLLPDEIGVIDAWVKIIAIQEAGIDLCLLRLATNFTARRNSYPNKSWDVTQHVALIRPLPRKHKGKTLEATKPDETFCWVDNEYEIRIEICRQLILKKVLPSDLIDVNAFYDPIFEQPRLLATPVMLNPEIERAIYKDRWRFA